MWSRLVTVAGLLSTVTSVCPADLGSPIDPAAWGEDYAGQELPLYVTGDECLFCHRKDVGPSWQKNRHQLTMRRIADDKMISDILNQTGVSESRLKEAEFILGHTNQWRLLKRSQAYGKLDMLNHTIRPSHPSGVDQESPNWDVSSFADKCAGCHTTAFDSGTKTFSATSIDCYSCHGNVDLNHTKDTSKVLLARKRKDPSRVVVSICGSCHIRTGKSKSTGSPVPNNFVPGDNLFRDFEVDLSQMAIDQASPIDRHVLANVRDVVVSGSDVSCVSCHIVHSEETFKHRRVKQTEQCWTCHDGSVRRLSKNWSHAGGTICDN